MDEETMEVIKLRDYPMESELARKIETLIHEYDNEISVVSVVGILDTVKHILIDAQIDIS